MTVHLLISSQNHHYQNDRSFRCQNYTWYLGLSFLYCSKFCVSHSTCSQVAYIGLQLTNGEISLATLTDRNRVAASGDVGCVEAVISGQHPAVLRKLPQPSGRMTLMSRSITVHEISRAYRFCNDVSLTSYLGNTAREVKESYRATKILFDRSARKPDICGANARIAWQRCKISSKNVFFNSDV